MATVKKRTWVTSKGEPRTAWKVDFTDQNGQRQRKQFDTKREADAFRVEVEGQIKGGTFRSQAATVTVSEVASDYLEMMEGRKDRREKVTETYLDLLTGIVRNYINPTEESRTDFREGIGSMKLAELTSRSLSAFRDRVRASGASPYHTRRVLSILARILDHAIGQDLLAVNLARGIKVIGTRDETKERVKPPSKADLRAVLDKADADTALRIRFAAATGCRASEMWALKWSHLDFDAALVKIETRVDRYGEEDVTKTSAGMRDVPMGEALIKALKGWKLRSSFAKPTDLVFPNTKGRHMSHTNFLHRKFDPIFTKLEEEDIEVERFNWHALRHYAVSTWIELNLNPKTIQTFAGHSKLQVTMDIYGHMFKSDDHNVAMDQASAALF